MSELLLIRHAETVSQGRILWGRTAGVELSAAGREQAKALGALLRGEGIVAVYASPLERARETAAALGLPVQICAAFHEIDYGEWTGQAFDVLENDPRWRAWNERRSTARVPGGESMQEVQSRVIDGIESVRIVNSIGRVAVVTHGDIIRAVLLFYKRLSLDCIHQIEVSPASVSRISFIRAAENSTLSTPFR